LQREKRESGGVCKTEEAEGTEEEFGVCREMEIKVGLGGHAHSV